MKEELAKAILAEIREDEIVSMCCDVVNIPSPTGEELEMGRYMRKVLEEMGLAVSWQEVEDARANVVGLWEGTGNGKSLMFNGHMDTSNTGRETFLTGLGYKPKAMIRDKMIYGLGIYNMKGALVCYTHAVKALMRAGVKLEGDLTIAAVVGEIEKTQWSHASPGQSRRLAGHVYSWRAHGYATCAWPLRHRLGATIDAWALRPHGLHARKARSQLHFSYEANPRSHLSLDSRLGEEGHLRWSARCRKRWLHPCRLPLARQSHSRSS
jgi:hypothetical protein